MKHKRNDPMCDPWDFQGNEKKAFSIFIAFCLIRNENIIQRNAKQETVRNNIASTASYKPSKLEGW